MSTHRTFEEILTPGRVVFGTEYHNLALLYLMTGRYAEAEELCKLALKISVDACGPDHPETGQVTWGLGRARWKQGRYYEAEELFSKAIRTLTLSLGADNTRTAQPLASYAEFTRDLMARGSNSGPERPERS